MPPRLSKNPAADSKFIKSRGPLLHHDEKHFTLPLADQFKSPEIEKALAPLQEQEREYKKRIPSGGSDTSPTRALVARRSDHDGNQAEHEQRLRLKARQTLSARRDTINNQIQQMEKTLSLIPNATNKKTAQQVKELETAVYFATLKLKYIIENQNRIIGTVEDRFVHECVDDPVGSAYLDMLLEKHIEPSSAKRTLKTNKKQRHELGSAFKTKLTQQYNAVNPDIKPGSPNQLWCPVACRYMEDHWLTAAHIVPNGVGELNAIHLFGPPRNSETGHLYDIGNGLLLCQAVEAAFDRARIAIVPANILIDQAGCELTDDNEANTDLTVIILDKSIEANEVMQGGIKFRDIANRKLQFKHPTHRPRFRYLYYHLCASFLSRQRHQCENWPNEWARLLHKRFWGSPEKGWIRHSSMIVILKRMGASEDMYAILDGGEMPTGEMEGGSRLGTADWDERTAVAVQTKSMKQRLRPEDTIDWETDDEEDDDSEEYYDCEGDYGENGDYEVD